jgi:hypothetical protein
MSPAIKDEDKAEVIEAIVVSSRETPKTPSAAEKLKMYLIMLGEAGEKILIELFEEPYRPTTTRDVTQSLNDQIQTHSDGRRDGEIPRATSCGPKIQAPRRLRRLTSRNKDVS